MLKRLALRYFYVGDEVVLCLCVSAPLWLCEDAGLIESNAAGFLTTEARRHRAKIIRLCALVVKNRIP